ncbi:hypothetical protein BRX37_19200 [Sphingomonas sp. S-NIH.Pt3_0716]|nr:hypothetical protein BRX37_19200 [Sphingomonas sp. S-NIH.Pt3_0716]
MKASLPLLRRKPRADDPFEDDFGGGSGFLFAGGNGRWIITAAHNAIGEKAHEDYSRWSNRLGVMLPDQRMLNIDLFVGDHPRFNHVAPIDGVKPDMIAIPITEEEFRLCATYYRAFTKADIVQVVNGEKVTAYGYPTGGDGPWPPAEASMSGSASVMTARVLFNVQLEEGFSGGPLLDEVGNLVGLCDSADAGGPSYTYMAEFVANILNL